MIKITQLTTHWETDQVISLIDMLDEIRQALIYTYQPELEHYRQQQWEARQQREQDNRGLFDDIDF